MDLEFEGIELEGIAEGSDMALIREDCLTSIKPVHPPPNLIRTRMTLNPTRVTLLFRLYEGTTSAGARARAVSGFGMVFLQNVGFGVWGLGFRGLGV